MSDYLFFIIYGIGVLIGIVIGISTITSIYKENDLDGYDVLLYGIAFPLFSWAFVFTMLLDRFCSLEFKRYK